MVTLEYAQLLLEILNTINYYSMKRCFYFLISILLLSCNTKNNSDISFIHLPEPTIISPEIFPEELIMSPPLQLKSFGDNLFFTQPGMGKCILFYNKKNKRVQYWGKNGGGPDDFIMTSCVYKNEKDSLIGIFDMNLRKFVNFRIRQTGDSISLNALNRISVRTDSISLIGLKGLDNGFYVGQTGLGSNDMFVLLDKNMKIQKTFGGKPIKEMPDANFFQMYGWMASWKNKLFFASQTTGYLVCYDISSNNIKKCWDLWIDKPLYDADRKNWKRENKNGFYDIQINEKYIFVSYSGKSFSDSQVLPQELLVFTHEGKLIKRIKYNKDICLSKFTVQQDTIYAIGGGTITRFNWRELINKTK